MNPRVVRASIISANVVGVAAFIRLAFLHLASPQKYGAPASFVLNFVTPNGRFLKEDGGIVLRHTSIIDIFFHRSERWQVQGDNGATVTAVY
jgi:hypothetical protein